MTRGIKGFGMNAFKKYCLSALLWSLTPLTVFAAQERGSSYYADSLSLRDGIDAAVVSAFEKAAGDISMGATDRIQINNDDAFSAVTSLRLNLGKLDVVFDTDKVAQVLEKYGAHAWQGLTNPIIVWMYEKGAESGNFVGDTLSSFAKAFSDSAGNNKYRLMFPLLDLEDIQSVTFDTLANSDTGVLAAASKRYGSDFVIASVIEHLPDGNVSVSCRLLDKDGKVLYDNAEVGAENALAESQAKAIAGVLSSFEQGSSAILAAQGDPDALGAQGDFVRMKLYGINNLNDLVAFERALSGIGVEGNVSCVMVDDSDAIIVNVYTKLDPGSLDGSLEHSSEFSKLEPFSYRYNHGSAKLNPQINSIGKASVQRPDTRIGVSLVSPVNFPAPVGSF